MTRIDIEGPFCGAQIVKIDKSTALDLIKRENDGENLDCLLIELKHKLESGNNDYSIYGSLYNNISIENKPLPLDKIRTVTSIIDLSSFSSDDYFFIAFDRYKGCEAIEFDGEFDQSKLLLTNQTIIHKDENNKAQEFISLLGVNYWDESEDIIDETYNHSYDSFYIFHNGEFTMLSLS